ncbi:hypothetical protein [Actinomadura formosensis]|uniref:hypothetical protein n=1 Tax=Actinomadura formosensis TaxID=60706 RepID=UPI003D8D5C88
MGYLFTSSIPYEKVGWLQASRMEISISPYAERVGPGIYIVRNDSLSDIIEFWNLRSTGANIIAVPANAQDALLGYFIRTVERIFELPDESGGMVDVRAGFNIWGIEHANAEVAEAITSATAQLGEVECRPGDYLTRELFWFPGITTRFRKSFHVKFDSGSHSAHLQLPEFPLPSGSHMPFIGVVAADVSIHSDAGQDPRLSSKAPPYRRHSNLIESRLARSSVDQARVTRDGLVLGIQAGENYVEIPFIYNLDIMEVLFDDKGLELSQSNEGKFQTRAAEMIGGAFSGATTQPGFRLAIELAANKASGISLQELKATFEKGRGEWPDPLYHHDMSPKDYVDHQVKLLLNSGLLVPTLAVHCSHCRVVSQVHPKDLDASIRCEFCGENFSLALSLALSKPNWRYRLAAHLSAEKVQALLPVLAVLSTLGQLLSMERPAMNHVLGLEVVDKGRINAEIDIAVILDHRPIVTILGEVKNRNRIDLVDIENLEIVQKHLLSKGVRCLIMVGSLKDNLTHDEIAVLRGYAERSNGVARIGYGRVVPTMPLILMGPDLSLPWGHDEHPWRWGEPGSGMGVYGTAIESCRRHLGLVGYSTRSTEDDLVADYEWSSDS